MCFGRAPLHPIRVLSIFALPESRQKGKAFYLCTTDTHTHTYIRSFVHFKEQLSRGVFVSLFEYEKFSTYFYYFFLKEKKATRIRVCI